MSIKKICKNCDYYEYDVWECEQCLSNSNKSHPYFKPKEELIRADEKNKFIKLLKSDLENFEGLANEYMKNNNIYDELIGNNAVRRYIEETIEVLKEE